MKHKSHAIATIALLSWPSFAVAQQTSLVRSVADGKPWSMVQANGEMGKITFSDAGKATMQIGDRTLSPAWREAENGRLCLKIVVVIPERCVTLLRDGKSIIGVNNGAQQFRLFRD